jgi:hypothetical protein
MGHKQKAENRYSTAYNFHSLQRVVKQNKRSFIGFFYFFYVGQCEEIATGENMSVIVISFNCSLMKGF